MCLGVPSRIDRIDGDMATVSVLGTTRVVSLWLLADEVAVGDHVLVGQGGFAVERLDPDQAQAALALIDALGRDGGTADVVAW